ncbi:hypothetical protein BDR06DRAFT_1011594 [Suillus hirtellus]|nr:hypothetical protein BDR06DRAFT_1011594 [Suillus hirtellus]
MREEAESSHAHKRRSDTINNSDSGDTRRKDVGSHYVHKRSPSSRVDSKSVVSGPTGGGDDSDSGDTRREDVGSHRVHKRSPNSHDSKSFVSRSTDGSDSGDTDRIVLRGGSALRALIKIASQR